MISGIGLAFVDTAAGYENLALFVLAIALDT